MAITEPHLFTGFPFPCVLISDAGIEVTGSALFPPPEGTTSEAEQMLYAKAPEGWSLCALGYAVYKRTLGPNLSIVAFGMKVMGLSTAQGKSEGLSIKADREEVERCVRKFIGSVQAAEAYLQAVVSAGVHEFRNVNKDLYNAAYQLRAALEQSMGEGTPEVETAKSIEALSEIMRVRSDLFDVITNPVLRELPGGTYPIYRSFDRIRRSLWRSAQGKGVNIRMAGASIGRGFGAQMFDVIPYIVLQNAIKYAPRGTQIVIEVREDATQISVNVTSEGPLIDEQDWPRIFSSNYRGEYARKMDTQGSGVGMFVARRLIDACPQASIFFSQRDEVIRTVRGIPFRTTEVRLSFKRAPDRQHTGRI